MDAQEFIDTARKADGYVRVTFPKTPLGLRCLKTLMATGKLVGMIPSAADRNEIENVMLIGWSQKSSFSFMDLSKIDNGTLHLLARDIVSVN